MKRKKTVPSPYDRLWKLIDGACADALRMHPSYLTNEGRQGNAARMAIVKRVVGQLLAAAGPLACAPELHRHEQD